jgi:tetratricopeptide (TPR) repeat protein
MRCASVARGLSDFQIVVQPLELEGVANVRSRPEKVPLSVAYVGLADLLAQVAEFDGALRDLDLAADADPLNSEIGVARGSILTQAGRWEEAKRALQGVLAKNANEEAAVSALGIVAWQGERDSPLAIQYLERALALPSSDLANPPSMRIWVRFTAGWDGVQRASYTLSRPFTQIHEKPRYYVNLGTALRITGRSAEAREQFLRALQIAPGYGPAQSELAKLDGGE